MEFSKYYIAGKDYIFIPDTNSFRGLTKTDVIRLCNRQKGVGADGIFTFYQNNGKNRVLSGFCKNGNIMRDFSSALICAVFEGFSTANIIPQWFTSENGSKITIKTDFSEQNRIFSCSITAPPANGIFRQNSRKTEIGNRILTVTPVELMSVYAVHFTECSKKLDMSYLGQHISANSIFRKEASLILAEQTEADSFDISFFENTTGNPRPVISAFAAAALAACRNDICSYEEEISVSCQGNTVPVICQSPESATISCSCEKVFTGKI